MGRFPSSILLNAFLVFGAATAMPSKPPTDEQPNAMPSKQVQETMVRQLCSKKDIPDCQNRALECLNLTNAANNGNGTTTDPAKLCPGISTVDCYEKILQCSEILKSPVGEWSPQEAKTPRTTVQGGLRVEDPKAEGQMTKGTPEMNLQQQAMLMCSVSDMPNCEREVKGCLKLAMMLKSSTDPEMMSAPDPSRCATTDIPDCEMKISKCQATMKTINENMRTQGSSILSNKQDAFVATGENVTMPTVDSKPKIASVQDSNSNMVPKNQTTMIEQGRNKTMTKIEEDEDDEGEEDKEEEEEAPNAKTSGRRRRRDDKGAGSGRKGHGGRGGKNGGGHRGHGSHADGLNHSHWDTATMKSNQLSSLLVDVGGDQSEKGGGTIIVNFADIMGGFENMIREIEQMMALVGAIMDQMDIVVDSTSNGEKEPGILSLEEKGLFLSKFLCKGDSQDDCKTSVEKCAAWLAPSPYLSDEAEDMESECAKLVPPSTAVSHNCSDLVSKECQAEALSCMNLMIATGGTAGDVGPLTAHAEECEKMMLKILKTSSCSAEVNETMCEMDIKDCMDTIRVEIDELYDHHSEEKLICEPIMRPAIALYMCSQRDESNCFSRMNTCLTTLSPKRIGTDTDKSDEMLECLKLTKPPVSVICGRQQNDECQKEYKACENLVKPNPIFIKAVQKCMNQMEGEDDQIKKDCMRPAFKEVRDSMKEDKGVQKMVTDLFENTWSPYLGITGLHSCMMMVCSMEVTLKA